MTLDEAIKRYTNNAEYERMVGNLQGCLEFRQLAEWLSELKELRERTEWIPVSERLPEDDKSYLVTVELTFARGERYVSKEKRSNWDRLKRCGHEIVAWMPLLESYKGESEDA